MNRPDKALSKYLARHAEPEAGAADGLSRRLRPRARRAGLRRAGEPLRAARLRAAADRRAGPDRRRPQRPRRLARRRPRGEPRRRASASTGSSRGRGAVGERPDSALDALPGGTLLVIDRASPGRFLPEGQGVGPRAQDRQRRRARAPRRGTPRLALAPQHRRRHAADPTTTSSRPRRSTAEDRAAGDLLLRAPLRGRPGPGAGRAALRDLAALLRAGARLGGIALRLPEHGQLPRDPGRFLRRGARISPQERRRRLLRPRQARQGRRDRAPGGHARCLLEGRPSDRVPFGTGRALRGPDRQEARRSPTSASTTRSSSRTSRRGSGVSTASPAPGGDAASAAMAEPARRRAPSSGPTSCARRSRSSASPTRSRRRAPDRPTPATLRRHLHTWFDAFRTLKLVARAARRRSSLRSRWREALAEAPFTGLSASTQDDPETLRRALAAAERTLAATPAGVPAIFASRSRSRSQDDCRPRLATSGLGSESVHRAGARAARVAAGPAGRPRSRSARGLAAAATRPRRPTAASAASRSRQAGHSRLRVPEDELLEALLAVAAPVLEERHGDVYSARSLERIPDREENPPLFLGRQTTLQHARRRVAVDAVRHPRST